MRLAVCRDVIGSHMNTREDRLVAAGGYRQAPELRPRVGCLMQCQVVEGLAIRGKRGWGEATDDFPLGRHGPLALFIVDP